MFRRLLVFLIISLFVIALSSFYLIVLDLYAIGHPGQWEKKLGEMLNHFDVTIKVYAGLFAVIAILVALYRADLSDKQYQHQLQVEKQKNYLTKRTQFFEMFEYRDYEFLYISIDKYVMFSKIYDEDSKIRPELLTLLESKESGGCIYLYSYLSKLIDSGSTGIFYASNYTEIISTLHKLLDYFKLNYKKENYLRLRIRETLLGDDASQQYIRMLSDISNFMELLNTMEGYELHNIRDNDSHLLIKDILEAGRYAENMDSYCARLSDSANKNNYSYQDFYNRIESYYLQTLNTTENKLFLFNNQISMIDYISERLLIHEMPFVDKTDEIKSSLFKSLKK